jgi:malate dehydrogenase
VKVSNGEWEIVQGLDVPEFSQARIDKTVEELTGERDAVAGLGLI